MELYLRRTLVRPCRYATILNFQGMAFNWQTFRTRTLTAAIFVVVMLAGLLVNRWTFLILFSIVHFGCWWEYFKLTEKIRTVSIQRYLKFGLMLLGFALMLWFCRPAYHISGYGVAQKLPLPLSAAGFALLLLGAFQKPKLTLKPFMAACVGLLYISITLGLMMNLYAKADVYSDFRLTTDLRWHDSVFVVVPYFYPVLIIASLWVNDTMAYIIGSLIGKTQMSKISPKKTWEGTIGGIILSAAVIFLLAHYAFHLGILSCLLAIIATLASIAGTIGDLFESKLKRMAGVKDSGHIMPGHGGFLDRFDSLLFATPFVWLYVNLFMH
jgi:phosphatidate cytidylyltransferase